MSTYTGFDMAPFALRWFVRAGTDADGVSGGPIYGIRGCPRHPDYDSAVSWSDAMAFRQGEFEEKYESGVEKTVRYELPDGYASAWLRSFFQSAEERPAVDVNGTIAVAVPDHASPEERDDVLAGLSATKYANVSLIWRPVAALLGWMDSLKNEKGCNLSMLLNRRIFVLDLDGGRPELTELTCVRHRRHHGWIVPSRRQPSSDTILTDDSFERACYKATLGGVEEWEQLVGGQFFADLQRAIESGDDGYDAWVRIRGAWTPKRVTFAPQLPQDILRTLNPVLAATWQTLGDDDILLVNGWIARKYDGQILSRFRSKCGTVEALSSDMVARGAALFAERLAMGLPTFYDRIADYQFWDGFLTKWVSMFDGEQDVEPGHEYRYPEVGAEQQRRLKIEKYADNVSFYVREPNSKEYARRIKTQFAGFLRSELELSLSAVIWPEKGSARFELAMCDANIPAIFVSGKTTAREIVLRWRSVDNADNKEVILDVVYNHTIEGNQLGPTLCYRGIDNESYYTLGEDKRFYYDSTGCGASFNLQNPYVLALVMDSMRYWRNVMHVDGFRLDLASSLSRVKGKFTQDSGLLLSMRQDESLRSAKIIAEPWDATMDGYRIGAFPPGWAEWNDRYRDVVRRFWRGDNKQIGEFASRISGSSDIFDYSNRDIWSSINFLTSHDGFNLHDLVSYNEKHNMVNGEENRDGNSANWSWNSGEEGESDNPEINKNRIRRLRAMVATLMMSFGTPMLVAGDEFGNTQFGNNNPYCQDNVLTWIVWEAIGKRDKDLARYVKHVIALRKSMKIFDRIKFFDGQPVNKKARNLIKDIMWLSNDGNEFTHQDWYMEQRHSMACFVYGDEKQSYMMIYNAHDETEMWRLPTFCKKCRTEILLDSSDSGLPEDYIKNGSAFEVPAWSVMVISIINKEN